MTTKTFLTSALAMGFVAPVMAAPTNTGTFPSTGLMQADYTYTNAATSTNMDGVYEGTVNAEAQYENILYTIGAGKYLPAGAEAVIDCNQSGYFCPGLQSQVQYDENNAQGLTSCSTATNGAYTLSDGTGSTADSCYRTCSGNVTIAHATGVTGYDYYGNGVDTCEPTACENGWHVKAAVPDLTTAIGTGAGASRAYIRDDGSFIENDAAHGQSYYGINGKNTWATDYGTNGMLVGQVRCSTQAGDHNGGTWINPTITANLADETGQEGAQYCYCNVTGYTPDGGTLQAVLSPWVFTYGVGNASTCANSCTSICSGYMHDTGSGQLAFRAALLGAIESSPAICEANTITINWTGASQAAINANNAGTATYDGDIRTPQSAEHVPGKTFTGWRFSRPQQTNLPE